MSYETPTEAIARVKQDFLAARKQFLQTLGGMPPSQVALPNVAFGAIDYNPASGNQDQEYVAVVNQSNTAVDVSGWTISGAATHTFEGGTVIPANSTYYAVADVVQFKLRATGPTGGQRLFIQGNYEGRLNNAYGDLLLTDQAGAMISSTSYGTPPLAGDYDSSGTVDNLDYSLWKDTFGSSADLRADGNANGGVDAGDYTIWRNNLGATQLGGSAATGVETASAAAPPAGSLIDASLIWHGSPGPVIDGDANRLRPKMRAQTVLDDVFAAWAHARDLALLDALADHDFATTRSAVTISQSGTDDMAGADDVWAEPLRLNLPIL
jgi:hypothetical protein